ncbi:MAG: EAL domain-containing protein [Burkholderiales bacterium]|nr:EAL domain-containing protein [Burkholderiales bacterium]
MSRIGGDEFLVILPATTVAEAFYVANKIRDAMMTKCLPISNSDQKEEVTVSLGVAAIPNSLSSLNEAVALAESALIMSKRGGKNQANVLGEDQELASKEQTDVRQCVMLGEEIRVFSQAIVDADCRIAGYELLMRGPSLSRFEMPTDFFASARHCNILGVADLLCLRRCLEASQFLPPCYRVHINMFPMTALETPLDELLKILALPRPFQLVLEFNEQEFLGNSRLLKPIVWALKSAGILIALDDVGFGSSSLETLLLLEPDIVKIDRCMIDGVADNEGKRRVLERLVACLSSLQLEMIAEGVEREEDAKVVMEMGIPFAQGFLWGSPVLISPPSSDVN